MTAARAFQIDSEGKVRSGWVRYDSCVTSNNRNKFSNWLEAESIPKSDIIHNMRANPSHEIHNIFEQDCWKSRVQTIRSYFKE